MIVKVKSIDIKGTTATITGDESSMEEVFDYVKIDSKAATGDDKTTIDPSTCGEGVIYNGLVDENKSRSSISTYAWESEGSVSTKPISLTFDAIKIGEEDDDDNCVTISGNVEHSIELSAKLYISWTYSYFEIKFNNSTNIDISITGKATGKIPFPICIFSPIPGVDIGANPSFVISVEGKVSLSGSIQNTVGLKASTSEGIQIICTSPESNIEIKAEVTVFIGILLEPGINVINDNVVKAGLSIYVGVEINAVKSVGYSQSDRIVHECKNCIQGEINFKRSISAEVKFLNLDHFKFETEFLNIKNKICDFYYSVDYHEFAFTTCPHFKYKVIVSCLDENKKPINNVIITADDKNYFTEEKCAAILYLPEGETKITAQKDNKWGEYTLNVDEYSSPKWIDIILSGKNYWRDVCLGDYHSAAVTQSGDLYMWGWNSWGQLGDDTTDNSYVPKKIMSDVLSVSLGGYHSAAITKNGDLYVWGGNNYGTIGDGTNGFINNRYTPKKIMSNVASVSLGGYHSAAITKNGDLYMWGNNSDGQLGDGTTQNSYIPKKIMSNVASVSLGIDNSAAITKNGDLYMWGGNKYGQLGDGTTQNSYIPKKIMYNISVVSLGYFHSAVITKNRDLYTCGYNNWGQLGDGTINNSYLFKKVMSDVYFVSLGTHHSSAITTNRNLYTWGCNQQGQLGDNTPKEKYSPTLITVPTQATTTTKTQADTSTQVSIKTQADTSTQVSIKTNNVKAATDTKTKNFSSLIPNGVYNFYSVKLRDTFEPLDTGNLLYMTQEQADENGNLSITYDTAKEYDNEECFVVAMDRIDISNANIKVDNLTENGEEQFVNTTVKLNDKVLTFGIDYEIAGDYSATKAGKYTVKIIGIGDYKGIAEANYKVLCDYEKTPLINNSKISATKITLGDSIKLTANATGGTAPYKYKYYCKPEGDSSWTALTNTTTNSTYTKKPARAINYQFAVKIADANGKTATKYFTVNVSNKLQNTSTISATKITLGDSIKLTANAIGGTAPYKYKYYCKPEGDSSWTALTGVTTKSTYTKKPARAINYQFAVKIADANGKTATKYFTVNVSK